MQAPRPRPTRSDLLASVHKKVPDLIARGLNVLWCGINPGLYSAWAGHHFARPGNRFWPALYASGFTERLLDASDEADLLRQGQGITNLVERATLGSAELTSEELIAGGRIFAAKVRMFRPKAVGILGVSAFRVAFNQPKAQVGQHPEILAGAVVWVLPNPSGLNAHFTPEALAKVFRKFRLRLRKSVR